MYHICLGVVPLITPLVASSNCPPTQACCGHREALKLLWGVQCVAELRAAQDLSVVNLHVPAAWFNILGGLQHDHLLE